MATVVRWGVLAGLWLVATLAWAAPEVPPVLESWRAWVLQDAGEALCTPVEGSARCAWPGELRLDADTNGLRFSHSWDVQITQRVPLPGDALARPLEVTVDGLAAPVVHENGIPMVLLAPGRHRVDGRIAWTRRPPTLAIPDAVALVTLRVDGAAIASPERNDEGALVLGASGVNENDDLQVETYRLLADGVPQLLATHLVLSVSGKPREQVLGDLLPDGFVPVLLDGEIPARIDPDGTLRVQLRPGAWSILLVARALAPTTQFKLPPANEDSPLPAQEIWQFRSDPLFRLAQLSGVPGVDPEQASVPEWTDLLDADSGDAWSDLFNDTDTLPAYLLDHDATATLDIKLRGLPESRPPHLRLDRTLWLDFDGDGYLAQDRITGELGGAQRLDMQAPWTLERAALDDARPMLVTQNGDGKSGVELRDPAVSLLTGARAVRAGALPANGWTQAFDTASTQLHLPPGYRLLGATGVDRAYDSWWDRWTLLDLFMLSLFALMAWRLGGIAFGAALVVWFLLAWHEPGAPRVSLLAAVALSLLMKHLPAGRLAHVTGWIRNAMLLLAIVLVVPFVAGQLRMAMHPQLENVGIGGDTSMFGDAQVVMQDAPVDMAMSPPPPPAPSMASESYRGGSEARDRVEVTGSRITVDKMFSYPADTIAQAGSAQPGWQWHDHTLEWNGPLLVDQSLGLIVSPPWLTRSLRVLAVLLIGFVLLQLGRAARPAGLRLRASTAPAWLAAALLATGALPMSIESAHAQTVQPIPSPELLAQLRERLLANTELCHSDCAGLGAVTAVADSGGLTLQLDAQAQAGTAWPLPRPDASLQLVSALVDNTATEVARDAQGDWIVIERGVHRVTLRYLANGERWRIAFPLLPAALDLRADGFEIAGLDDGRLVGGTLELVPPRATSPVANAANAPAAAPNESVPPFVRVTREVRFDQQWETSTRVTRVAPLRSGLTVSIALLPGEQIVGAEPEGSLPPVRDGRALVSLPAGADRVTWRSRLTPADTLRIAAGDGRGYAEEWRLVVAPLLHVETSGMPQSGQAISTGQQRFLPLPGEALDIAVTRPAATAGASVAIDNVQLRVDPGQHARDSTLAFRLRATRAGQHALTLPAGAELLGFSIDGNAQPLLLDAGALALPLRTQPQNIELRWREPVERGMTLSTPAFSLGASTSNIDLQLTVPQDRWLLFTRGPVLGPAVLFWSGLVAMLLAAFVLARVARTPLRLHEWLLLGLGFSTISWWPALIVAGWLLLVGWRGRHPELIARRSSMFLQLGIGAVTLLALLCLLLAIPYGLLGEPDMQVTGNQSSGGLLRWFADRAADGTLPVAHAITLPLWCYKLAILAWSLWLASALLRWLRWTWASLNAGGAWPAKPPKKPKPEPAAE